MPITKDMIAGVVTSARAVFTDCVFTIKWQSEGQERSVTAFRPDGEQHDSEGNLDGVVPGVRGVLVVRLSDCTHLPPVDGDIITLFDSDDAEVGVYSILGHRPDPTNKAIRRLQYGEESA